MADNLGIRIEIDFEQFGVVNNKLKDLLKRLQESNKLDISFDKNSFKSIDAQIDNFKQKINNISTGNINTGNMSNEFKKAESNIKSTSNAIKEAHQHAENFGSMLIHDMKMFGTWMLVGTAWMQSIGFFKNGLQYAYELNQALTQISIVTSKNQDQVARLGETYQKTAFQMGVLTKNIADASVEFYRQGLSQEDVMKRTVTATQYAKISNLEFKESAEILTATVNSMNVDVERASDVFALLGDATATGADEIGRAFQKVGGTASTLGVSFEKVSSWIAVVSARTREGAESIGNGIKSIMARYTQLRENGFAEEDGTKVNQVAKALASVGVEMIDANGQFKDFGLVMDQLGEKWEKLDSRSKAYISTQLAGTYQLSRFQNLMEGYSDSISLYEQALDASGTTTSKYNLYLQGTEAHLNRLKSVGESIFIKVFDSEDLKNSIDLLTNLLQGISSLIDAVGFLNPIVFTLSTVLLATNKSFQTWLLSMDIAKVKGFTTTFSLLPQVFKITGAEAGVAATKVLWLGTVLDVAKIKAIAFQAVLTMGISLAITGIISLLTGLITKTQTTTDAIQKLNDEMSEVTQTDKLISKYEALQKQMDENTQSGKDNAQVKQQLIDIQKQFADTFKGSIDGYTAEGEAILQNLEAVKKLNEEKRKQVYIESQDQYNSLQKDLTKEKYNSRGMSQGSSLYQLQYLTQERDKRLAEGKFSQASQFQKDIDPLIEKVEAFNELAIKLSAITGESYQIVDLATMSLKDYSSAMNSNTQAQKDNASVNQENSGKVKTQADAMKSAQEAFQSSTNAMQFYNNALDELNDNHKLSGSTVNDIFKSYPQLLAYVGDETALRKKLIQLIEEEGNTQRQVYSNMIMNSEEFYNARIKGNVQLTNELRDKYNIDLQNYKSLAQAKSAIEAQLLNDLSKKWGYYFDTVNKSFNAQARASNDAGITTRMMEGVNSDPNFLKLQEVENYFSKIAGSFTPASFKSVNLSGVSAGSKSADDAKRAAEEAQRELEQRQQEALQNVKDVESKITEIIKKEFEKRKQATTDYYNSLKEAIDKEKEAYNRENEAKDYNKELTEQQAILAEIDKQIVETRDRTTPAGQARLESLNTQRLEQEKKVNEMIEQNRRDLNNQMFDDEKARLDEQMELELKALDEKYSDENVAKMVNSSIISGQLKNIDGTLISTIDAYRSFEDRFGEGMTTLGKTIKSEFIDKFQEVQKLLKGMGGVDIGIRLSDIPLASFAVGTKALSSTGVIKAHENEAILPESLNPFVGGEKALLRLLQVPGFLPKISTPNILNNRNTSPSININTPLISIAGDVHKDMLPAIDDLVERASKMVSRDIVNELNNLSFNV